MSCFGSVASYLFGRTEVVNGRNYRVVRKIGEGGFSYVDLVNRQGHNFALKRMLLQVPEQWDAVENEIQVHRQIKHKNVIQLVESEMKGAREGQGVAMLIFPFYRNGTLQELIEHMQRAGQPLNETKILELFLSLCRGLQAMHMCSTGAIAHRDIKPGNLLLTDGGDELVLMDLGSARSAECTINNRHEALALQELCAQTCTAHYRAPELFEVPSNCIITAKTDIWSLGCSLYAAAFGQSPCDGSALAAVSGKITFPKKHSYTRDYCDLLEWILVVDPEARPSIEEVQVRIESIIRTQLSTDEEDSS